MRSRAITLKGLLPAIVALILILPASPACVNVPVQTIIPPSASLLDVQEQALLDAINVQRLGGGIARERSAEMVSQGYFSHTGPQGDTRYLTLLTREGATYAVAGETLALNCCWLPDSAGAAMSGFLASPVHRELLMRPAFTRAGVGVEIGADGKTIYTVVLTG
jgi:uncharacterized protein YkwD